MLRKILFPALAAALVTLLVSSQAQAWGGYHVGYTHVGPGGAYHYGRTVGYGGYGGYSGAHYGAYGYGGASRYGYHYSYGERYGGGYSGGYHYSPSYYGGYHYGGVRYGYGYRY
jgi:hypothetical protein